MNMKLFSKSFKLYGTNFLANIYIGTHNTYIEFYSVLQEAHYNGNNTTVIIFCQPIFLIMFHIFYVLVM